MDPDRDALLERIFVAEQRMWTVLAYDGALPPFSLSLTMQQLKVLILVYRTDGLTAQQLTKHLGVSQATVSGLVDRLVAHEYVSRHEDPRDRRIRHIRLAPAGKQAVEEFLRVGVAQRRKLYSLLDDETLHMLEVVLDRLVEAASPRQP